MTDFKLNPTGKSIPGNLLLIIMDGIGIYKGKKEGYDGNALDLAEAPVLKNLLQQAPLQISLQAHGIAVGLPSNDDMGNSEVGHNAFGAGRVFDQGAKLVGNALKNGSLYKGKTWQELIGTKDSPGYAFKSGASVHLLGLLSDGNVHSHIDHLLSMIERCARDGVQNVFIHILLDGRDVEKQSAHKYIEQLENNLAPLNVADRCYKIASGGGRMKITMDRYGADWGMVALGWQTHVKAQAKSFGSALDAIKNMRNENPDIVDQDLAPFVIERNGKAIGPIKDNDVVILYNFRGDRAIEISQAFTQKKFDKFKRDPEVNVHYAGIMQYDGDLGIPPKYLVEPPVINNTLSEYMVHNNLTQYAISETQKFGHVTYFWNGNNSEKFSEELEKWCEIPSDNVSFDQKPRMKADEITDALIAAIKSNQYKFMRVNFANGDMVGHTGNLAASIAAVEAVDQNLARLLEVACGTDTTIIITADHGNCEQMYEVKKDGSVKNHINGNPMAKTSHTLNPVPFIVTGPGTEKFKIDSSLKNPGLANVAASVLTLLGYESPADFLPSLIV